MKLSPIEFTQSQSNEIEAFLAERRSHGPSVPLSAPGRMELKDRKIRANVISPGTIDTPILAPLPKQAIAQIVASIPMGRMGSADEIAKAAVFLASDDSSFVTGIELFVDGGTAQV